MQWLRSKSFDAVFMMGGLWMMAIVILLEGTGGLTQVHYALAILFWIGHRLTTTYIAYCQEAYREHLTKQRTRFLVIPAIVLVTVFVMVCTPESILPIPILYRLLPLAVLDFFWEFYHFIVQHYGVVSVYRTRAGQDPGAVQAKRREKFFCYFVFGAMIPLAMIYHALNGMAANDGGIMGIEEALLKLPLADLAIPMWTLQVIRVAGIVGALGYTIYAIAMEYKDPKASLPKALYMFSVGAPVALTFVYDSMGPALLILAVQHWMISVGLTSHMAAGKAPVSTEPNAWYRFWNVFNRSPWAVMALMCVGSAVLAPVMEFADVERRFVTSAVRASFDPASATRDYIYWGAQYLDWFQAIGRDTVISIFIATGFALGYVHYLMDRAVYRFSDPDTRRQTIPLIFQ